MIAADDNRASRISDRSDEQIENGFLGVLNNRDRLAVFRAQILNKVDRPAMRLFAPGRRSDTKTAALFFIGNPGIEVTTESLPKLSRVISLSITSNTGNQNGAGLVREKSLFNLINIGGRQPDREVAIFLLSRAACSSKMLWPRACGENDEMSRT